MKIFRSVILFLLFVGVVATPAQDFSSFAFKMPWLEHFFVKLNPDTPEFSAIGDMKICNDEGMTQFILPVDLIVSTNAVRWNMDTMKIWPLPPQAQTAAKMTHTDKMALLARLDRKQIFVIYPDLQAYVALPIPDSVMAEFDADKNLIKIEKTELGQETVSGHVCVKVKVVDSEPNIKPQEGTIWCAIDLKNFPIQMELHPTKGIMKFSFLDVQIGKPDGDLLEVPTNYKAFTSVADVMRYAKDKLNLP